MLSDASQTPLAADMAHLPELLEQTQQMASAYLASIAARPPAAAYLPKSRLSLPEEGSGAQAALALFAQRYGAEMPASNGPRFWGFVTGGATPAALIGDWLTSTYDLNLTSAANSNAPDIEYETLDLLRDLFGLPAEFGGHFVTGATMANFAGLAIAREWLGRQRGVSIAEDGLGALQPVQVLGGEAHSSIYKALAMAGLGRRSWRSVSLLGGDREAVDCAALERDLAALNGEPAIVVANAGTVNTVDFDDLRAIAALKERHPFWLHIDAAFGGFAACSPRFQPLVAGLESADSLTIDAHKWLNVPYDAAMIFTPHRELQRAVFHNSAAYLGSTGEAAQAAPVDFVHMGPENSRRLRALPAWFSLMAYGRDGYRRIVEENCRLAQLLGERVAASREYTLLAPVRMNVVCFTLAGVPASAAIQSLLARLRDDGRVFLTPTSFHGIPAMRAAFSNWRTTTPDVEIAWQALVECWQTVA